MLSNFILAFLGTSTTLSQAQISSGSDGTTVSCTGGGNAYCAANSLSTNIIIRCSGTKGQPGNCNDNLAFVPPVGVKIDALCYQTTPSSGDAACSFNGIVYPDTGSPFAINGTTTNATSSSTASTSASVHTAPGPVVSNTTTSASIPTAPGPVVPIKMTIVSIPTAPGLPTGLSASSTNLASIPTAPGLPTGLSTLSATPGVPRALSTISTGAYVSYSAGGGAPYPLTSTKIMTAPTAGTGGSGASGATGGSTGTGGAHATGTPSTSPITSSSRGVVVVAKKSVGLALFGVAVGMVVGVWM